MTDIEQKKYNKYLEEYGDKGFDMYMRWKCCTDLYFLGSKALGLEKAIDRTSGKHILDAKFHFWLAGCIDRDESLTLVPRRHCKSTWIKYKIVQEILKNPNVRIGLYSSTGRLVEQMLDDLKRLLSTPLLIQLFPDVLVAPGKKYTNWERCTANMFTIKRDESLGKPPQECQVEAYGVGANVTGKHFDKHFYDDLVTKDNITTQVQVAKVRDWYAHIQGVLEPYGSETMIGTPYHYSDLYATCRDEEIYKYVNIRGAIESGKPIYNFYTVSELNRLKKRMGNYVFSCQMMCNPIPKEDQIFPPPQPVYDTLPAGEYNYYISLDPAATATKSSDESAFTVAAVDSKLSVFIVECFGVKKSGAEVARILIKLNEKYKPRRIGVEFGLMENLKYIIANEKSYVENAQGNFIAMPIEPIKLNSKQSKYDRINWTLGSFVREGRVKLHNSLHRLMEQMGNLTPNYSGKDDLVDSASMIFQIVENFSYRYQKKKENVDIIMKDWFTVEELRKPIRVGTREALFVR